MNTAGLWQTIFTGLLWLSLPGIFALAQDDADDQQERGDTQVESTVVAQPRQDADEEKDDDEMDAAQAVGGFGNALEKMVAAKRFQLTQIFEGEIEALDRICKLEPEQKSKLQVGAKGSVRTLTATWEERIGPSFGGNKPNKKNSKTEEKEPVEIKDANEIDANVCRYIMAEELGNPFNSKSADQSEVWKKLVASILNSDQANKWGEFKKSQLSVRKNAAVENVCASLSSDLSLTTEQATRLKEILSSHFENVKSGCATLYESSVYYYQATKVSDEELKSFLSPAQVQKFRLVLLPIKEIGPMLEAEKNDEED